MKRKLGLKVLAVALGIGLVSAAHAYDSDWKRGRIYYRQVCTACHKAQANKSIGPNEKTQAEWKAYLQADKHSKGKDSVKHYFSKQYRDSVKATNAAAAKFANVPDNELLEDVKAFLIRSAKDGDAPAGCS